MPSYNKVILVGHLTRDIEVRHSQGGTTFGVFGLAVNHKYGKGDDRKESVCYIDCTAFGKTAETMADYLAKGSAVLIEGRLDFQQWDDRETGGKRSKHAIIVDRFAFIGSKNKDDSDFS